LNGFLAREVFCLIGGTVKYMFWEIEVFDLLSTLAKFGCNLPLNLMAILFERIDLCLSRNVSLNGKISVAAEIIFARWDLEVGIIWQNIKYRARVITASPFHFEISVYCE
jgi:hypothetical protein